MEWQDIESAPRDGTMFLAFQPGKRGACVVRARTDAMRVDSYRQPQADVCWRELPEAPYSHWMSLPAPPKAAPEQEQHEALQPNYRQAA